MRAQLVGNGLAVSRVGYALVGVRSAVRRNRLRRRLREAVRPLLGALAGHDVVILAGVEAAGLSHAALSDAVRTSTSGALTRGQGADPASRADNGHMGSATEHGTMTRASLLLIRAYRVTVGPLFALVSSCRFEPTCSQYGQDAIVRFGCRQGWWLALRRIGRCQPFYEGGHDPVPEQYESWRATRRRRRAVLPEGRA